MRHLKAFDILSTDDRREFEALLRVPATTVDSAFGWMIDHGYQISRGAVHNAKRSFNEVLESVKRSSEMAAAYSSAARDGAETLSEATVQRFQQLLMDKMMSIETGGELDADELSALSAGVKNGIGSRQAVVKMLAEKFDKASRSLTTRKTITAEDIAEVRKAVFG